MSRASFLTIASLIALLVGAFALLGPDSLLATKGVAPSAPAQIWVREVGVALIAIAVAAFLMRRAPDSPALRAFLIGNAVLQVGLFPIEIVAYAHGVITSLAGILPNSVLHLVLAAGFAYFAARVERPGGAPARARSSG